MYSFVKALPSSYDARKSDKMRCSTIPPTIMTFTSTEMRQMRVTFLSPAFSHHISPLTFVLSSSDLGHLVAPSEDEHAERDDGRPLTLRVPFGALHDVACLQEGLLHLEGLLALAPRLLGVELDAEGGREHRGGEILGVVAGGPRRL